MAGYEMTAQDEEDIRRMFRGELTGDEAVLLAMERDGYGDSERAKELRTRIAESKKESQRCCCKLQAESRDDPVFIL